MSRRRMGARAALAALALLAVYCLATFERVLIVAGVLLVVAPAAAWFALTTRKAWKRLVSLVLGAVALAALLAFSLAQVAAVAVLVLLGVRAVRVATARPAGTVISRPVAPERPWLLVNPWSGRGTAGRVGLVAAAEAAGFQVHVLARGEDPAELARRAAADGAGALAVAGGDGTLALVASVGLELDLPFLCVPAGTRNHFARDLGLDRSDPLAALRGLDGPEVRVDAAFVGDRLFLNNVSLGAYADVVGEPCYRNHKLDTSRVVIRRLVRGERAPAAIVVHDPAGRRYDGVQLLQVANNGYHLHRLGGRTRLDSGLLQVSALRTRTGAAMAGLAARAAVGRARSGPGLAQWDTPALTVESPLPTIAAGVDGEAVSLTTPLVFRIRPRALRILVPPPRRHDSHGTAAPGTVSSPISTGGRP